MSKINFCALGGLGENGKNLYVVTVDNKIFLLDAGLKFPSIDLYGIDAVLPDISYLVKNKQNIVGIFLSHGHDEYFGAVTELLRNFNVPVYGSHFTMALVEYLLLDAGMNIDEYKLYRITDEKVLNFGDVSISFFYITHSIPECMGLSIKTKDGAICYVPDFSFTFTGNQKYQTSFDKLSHIGKDKVLLLCPESLGVNNVNRIDNDYTFIHTITDALQMKGRVIFSMFSHDLNRIQKVVDLCVVNKRKIAILGRKVQKTINIAMNEGYLKCPGEYLVNLKFIDDSNKNDDDNLVVIVTGIRHEPYFMLQRMISKVDKLIHIDENDTIVLVSPPVLGTEKIATRTIDRLNRENSKVINITRSMLKSSHADGEDLKMLYQIINPEYICPVIGEYRHQYVHKNIAVEAGYSDNKILMLENGEEITFIDGVLQKPRNKIPNGDVLVDGSIVGDINEIVLRDRECLSQEGTLIIVLNIDSANHKIISGPKVEIRGFISENAFEAISEEINDAALDIITNQLKNEAIDWNELKSLMKEKLNKIIRVNTRKSPIVIPVIIDVTGEDL